MNDHSPSLGYLDGVVVMLVPPRTGRVPLGTPFNWLGLGQRLNP